MGLVGRTLAAMAVLGTLHVTPATTSFRPQPADLVPPTISPSTQHSSFDTINLPKKVFVHRQVYGLEENLLPYRKHEARILGAVEEFYRRYGIEIEFLTADVLPFRPAANHVRLAVMDEDTYYAQDARYRKDFRVNDVLHPRLGIKMIGATTEFGPRTISLKVRDSDKDLEREEGVAWAVDESDTIAHELGHLLSLDHIITQPTEARGRFHRGSDNIMERGVLDPNAVETHCGGLICGKLIPSQVEQIHRFLTPGTPQRSESVDATASDQLSVPSGLKDERKTVYVHYQFEQRFRTSGYRLREEEILKGVRQVYDQHDIELVFFKGTPPVELPPGHIRLEVLDQYTYRTTVPCNPDCQLQSYGFADRERRTAYVKVWLRNVRQAVQDPATFVGEYIDTIGHEIGHVLGLSHTAARQDVHATPNMMETFAARCPDHRVPCSALTRWQAEAVKRALENDATSANSHVTYTD